eukprot:2569205-Pleurochrysis_carterae.AAC.4
MGAACARRVCCSGRVIHTTRAIRGNERRGGRCSEVRDACFPQGWGPCRALTATAGIAALAPVSAASRLLVVVAAAAPAVEAGQRERKGARMVLMLATQRCSAATTVAKDSGAAARPCSGALATMRNLPVVNVKEASSCRERPQRAGARLGAQGRRTEWRRGPSRGSSCWKDGWTHAEALQREAAQLFVRKLWFGSKCLTAWTAELAWP